MPRLAAAVAAALALAAPAAARESYVDGFVKHWTGAFSSQSSIVMVALGVGAVGIFIITRAKWKK